MNHAPESWKADYERDGYLVVPDLVDPDTLRRMRDALDRITANPRSVHPSLVPFIHFEQDYLKNHRHYNDLPPEQLGDAIRIIMELARFDPIFERLVLYDPLLDVVQTLFESTEFGFLNWKCVVKAPHVGSAFCWHRDLPYLNHTTPNVITAMLCVDDMTERNGATVVLPGTHRIPHEACKPEDMDIPESQLPTDAKRVTVTCPAGSAVLFHANIIHGGGPNRSSIPRRNVIGIWTGPDTYPVKMNRYAYQGVCPRSTDPARQKQVRMSFAHLMQPA